MQNKKNKFRFSGLPNLVIIALIASFIGCGKKDTAKPNSPFDESQVDSKRIAPATLTLLVIGDEEVGNRTNRQWSARREGTLKIQNLSAQAFIDQKFQVPADVDVVVYPPAMMGELVTLERLQKIPRDFWESDGINKNGLLRHFRTTVLRYRGDVWAVPLGSPNFALLGNRKLFEELEMELPTSWEGFEKTLEKIVAANMELQAKVDMPLSEGWAANTLLIHVASSIRNRGKLSTVFDRRTMKPLITSQPFIQALERIKNTATERSLKLAPKQIFELANSGESSMALSWPARGFSPDAEASDETIDSVLKIGSVPGSPKWFDHKSGNWHMRSKEDDVHVDLIGFTGLVASVSSKSPNQRTAWEFLEWWPSQQISLLTLTESPTLGPFRASQLGDMSRWAGDTISIDVADEYADVVGANHERSLSFMFPRILAQNEYLEILDQVVRACVSGSGSAEDALNDAATQWEELTERIGREKQVNQLRKESGS